MPMRLVRRIALHARSSAGEVGTSIPPAVNRVMHTEGASHLRIYGAGSFAGRARGKWYSNAIEACCFSCLQEPG